MKASTLIIINKWLFPVGVAVIGLGYSAITGKPMRVEVVVIMGVFAIMDGLWVIARILEDSK